MTVTIRDEYGILCSLVAATTILIARYCSGIVLKLRQDSPRSSQCKSTLLKPYFPDVL